MNPSMRNPRKLKLVLHHLLSTRAGTTYKCDTHAVNNIWAADKGELTGDGLPSLVGILGICLKYNFVSTHGRVLLGSHSN